MLKTVGLSGLVSDEFGGAALLGSYKKLSRMMLKDLVHQLQRQKRHDGGIVHSVGMKGHHG